jgi:hypothetical protein
VLFMEGNPAHTSPEHRQKEVWKNEVADVASAAKPAKQSQTRDATTKEDRWNARSSKVSEGVRTKE